MPEPEWIRKTCIISAALVLPAAALLALDYRSRHRATETRQRRPFAFSSAFIVLVLFVCSILNIVMEYYGLYRSHQFVYDQGVAFMLAWPLVGIFLTGAGLVTLMRREPPDGGWLLGIANVLLLITSFASLVAPN